MRTVLAALLAASAALTGFGLSESAWRGAKWIASPEARELTKADRDGWLSAAGTDCFLLTVTNAAAVRSARWRTAGRGVYEAYVNGRRVGDDFLKPGHTHAKKRTYYFEYDVTDLFRREAGAANELSALVSSGWWRDRICGHAGKRSAFRALLEVTYADGSVRRCATDDASWRARTGGPVVRAGIYDGEEYDARLADWTKDRAAFKRPILSDEFTGETLPSAGAEVTLRTDLARAPVEAYVWKGATGALSNAFGRIVRTRTFRPGERLVFAPGETLVLDFGQNAAFVPEFAMSAPRGTRLECLPGEALNDANGETARGNDGPGGSVYRANLRIAKTGCRLAYVFAGTGIERYLPRFTYFGYRYLSISATAPVAIESVRSVPVSSIRRADETGRIETGDAAVNRLLANAYWGQLSNYLSVPTDCPQRNERAGWLADTQVFTEAGAYMADVRNFFRKWMRDVRDTQAKNGGFPGVAPCTGSDESGGLRFGWSDAGVIVPYRIWRQFGDLEIVRDNWDAMTRYLALADRTKYDFEASKPYNEGYQWADWLSFEKYESFAPSIANNWHIDFEKPPEMRTYWSYLGACYWLEDAKMMSEMAAAIGRADEAAKYRALAARAKAHLKATFFAAADGGLPAFLRDMQTPALFALHCGLVEGAAKERTIRELRANFAAHGGSLQTGFLGTSILMDTLTACGQVDLAYSVLLNHNFPGWLSSVDQGATTIWERWNSYTKEKGFGPVDMNSFNHYAYGAVAGWLYKTAAGIASDPKAPGWRHFILKPRPDRRLKFVKAEYRTPHGTIASDWRYEGDRLIWNFTIPAGTTASVTVPGTDQPVEYPAGTHRVSAP